MNYSSLPTFPPPQPSKSATPPPRHVRRLTPRQARVLIDLAKLAGLVALLVWLRHTADTRRPVPPPPQPLPFKVVAERFAQVHVPMPADEALVLLGPQRWVEFREQEMDDHDMLVWAHPDRYPEPRFWAKWADPADRGRWVAVFICGGRVYKTLKRGV